MICVRVKSRRKGARGRREQYVVMGDQPWWTRAVSRVSYPKNNLHDICPASKHAKRGRNAALRRRPAGRELCKVWQVAVLTQTSKVRFTGMSLIAKLAPRIQKQHTKMVSDVSSSAANPDPPPKR